MAKSEWGVKRTCLACGVRFYDFRREPIICPQCEAEFQPDAALRPRRSRTMAEVEKPVAVAAAASTDDDDDEKKTAGDDDLPDELAGLDGDDDLDEEDSDDSVIEDTSDLGADEDDLSEVAENIEKGDDD